MKKKIIFSMLLIAMLCVVFSGCVILQPTTYTIKFDSNGGSEVNPIEGIYNQTVVAPQDPVKEGYEFLGWFIDKELTQKYEFTTLKEIEITLYAKWKVNGPFSIMYVGGEGSIGDGPTSYKLGQEVVLPTDWVRQGYTFDGWYLEEDYSGNKITKITSEDEGSKVLYAKWIPNNYIISFISNGGSKVDDLVAPYGSNIIEPQPTKYGHVFAGWYEDKALTVKYDFDTMGYGNKTLYAKWLECFNITYKDGDKIVYEKKETTNTINLIDPLDFDFNRPDYFFMGWYLNPEYSVATLSNTVIVTEDTTFYAKWERKSFLPYLDKFEGHGNTKADIIEISSKHELIAFGDYIIFTNDTKGKWCKLTYLDTIASNNQMNELLPILTNNTMSICYSTDKGHTSGEYLLAVASGGENKQLATGYKTIPGQVKKAKGINLTMEDKVQTRSSSFDNFKYKDYTDTIRVSTSNQLFYALQYGINPIVETGSDAEKMLNKAKVVLRKIIDDDMTDLEKVYAIYSYLVNNVHYDHKAVGYNDPNTALESNVYDSWHIEGVLNNGVAVCDGIAKTAVLLTRLEGIPCIRVIGSAHAWNKVYIDIDGDGVKEWYCFDATWGDTSSNIDNIDYEFMVNTHFLFRDDFVVPKKERISTNHKDVVCNTDVDQYKTIFFEENNKMYDMNIENLSEINILVSKIHDILNSPLQTNPNIITTDAYISVSIKNSSIYVESVFVSKIIDAIKTENKKSSVDKDISTSAPFKLETSPGYFNFIFVTK